MNVYLETSLQRRFLHQAKTEAAKQGSEQPATPQFVISLKTTMAITLCRCSRCTSALRTQSWD